MSRNSLIVGAGPVGGFLATKLTNISIIDQKARIGNPVRCTGILTTELENHLKAQEIKKFTLNKINETEVIGPNSKARFNLSTNYIICNTTFEEFLINKATNKGNELLLQHKYLGTNSKGHEVRDMKTKMKKTLRAKQLIGCDGPQSEVAKHFNLMQKRKNYIGLQVRLKVKDHENIIKFYPHISTYAWYTPESDTVARVGICTDKNAPNQLNTFLKRFKGTVLEKQAGFIPYHQPFQQTITKTKQHNVTLLGDSASQVKNTTGGGIIPGMIAGSHLAKNGFTSHSPKIKRELYAHFLVHNLIKHNSNKEWDFIINSAKRHTADLEHINRDELIKLAPRFLTNPKLIGFGMKKLLTGQVSLL